MNNIGHLVSINNICDANDMLLKSIQHELCKVLGVKPPDLNFGEDLGEIGEPTELIDSDGNALFVGDIVNVKSNDIKNKDSIFFTCVVRDKDGAFIVGIKNACINHAEHKDFTINKIIDHTAVKDGAIIKNVKYVKPLTEV